MTKVTKFGIGDWVYVRQDGRDDEYIGEITSIRPYRNQNKYDVKRLFAWAGITT